MASSIHPEPSAPPCAAPGSRLRAGVRLHEEPLQEWRDVAGSKLRPRHLVGAALDLSRIAVELRRRPRP